MAFGRPENELLSILTSAQLTEYIALHRIDPCLGGLRSDYHAALIAAAVAAAAGNKVKLSDYLIDFDPPPPPTQEELDEMNGRILLSFFECLSHAQG